MEATHEEQALGSGQVTRPDSREPAFPPSPRPSELTAWGRWAWRTLTSMRTAIVLLVLLALTAVPGSLLPQRGVASDPAAVANFAREHPDLAPWLDRLSLFNVYSAPWFAAVYVLLLVSMTGCVIPRCMHLWREFRSDPPAAPRHLSRETGHLVGPVERPQDALDAAAGHLEAKRFRVSRTDTEVRAEKGRLRELGNLAFHLSLLVLLFGIAGGKLFGYEGRVALVEGTTFANVSASYDALSPAPWADLAGLEPLELTLDDFSAEFETEGTRLGEPRDFEAAVTYSSDDEGEGSTTIRPNQPLDINGTKFFLTGHGYAPELTVRDGNGDVAASGPTIFLPVDQTFTSDGVIKAPDARPGSLALQGVFLPTAVTGMAVSAYPDQVNPIVELTAYTGDLGLDDGSTQSVFTLDFTDLDQVRGKDGKPWRVSLAPGQTARLPGGLGSVTFDDVSRFANFQIARDPGKEVSLLAAILLLLGLTASLSVPRRRIWVRRNDDGTVEIAGRSLSRRPVPPGELEQLADTLGLSPADAGGRKDQT
ncbi:cytochrome c biogenesis protein ResB [Nocardioides glacieisoli]|uniref:Cytochrome c biogenesis protein ResB n=1 Tax=Nocardioides glacieisoli TaxID=1168730 RepID=A0A4Q2RK27_9ACTN|nr:cytochrome c biogenesis protein ResB [Nocardioides glacieisoli]RYB89080.1 cytochrome c biogenesis protein ResB [Nocardioides glacieisoli]